MAERLKKNARKAAVRLTDSDSHEISSSKRARFSSTAAHPDPDEADAHVAFPSVVDPSSTPASLPHPSGSAVELGGSSSSSSYASVTLVLEQASLESVKTKRGFELLNCDDHGALLRRHKRDPAESRPDILHQLLLAALDSPLNKAGHLRILVQAARTGVLVEVSPSTRIPRTFKRFCGLMVQLLHKMRVRAADGSDTLLRVVRNPVTSHLPVGATVVGLEVGAPLVDAFDLPAQLPRGRPVVFVVGAMSHGDIAADYITRTFSLSRHQLSAACALSKLLNGYEHHLGVL
jgi:rRNA small subunit pseudouridine methyltransferase Nep1